METFEVLKFIFNQAVIWMKSIKIFNTNLFALILGFMAVNFVIIAIKFFFGGSSGGSTKEGG